MTHRTDYTRDDLHEFFHHFLMGKFEDDAQEVKVFIETAEDVLPPTLNEYFGTRYASIYDIQDENEIESLRKKIKAHTVLKNIDKQEEPRYTEVLKWYRLFVKSLHNESSPIQVPGEDAAYHSPVDDKSEPAIEHNDADLGRSYSLHLLRFRLW